MPTVRFTQNLVRHVSVPDTEVTGATVRESLEVVFQANPSLRSYVLDDQGRLRQHVMVFVDGEMVRDREQLGDAVQPSSEVYVMQALSGG